MSLSLARASDLIRKSFNLSVGIQGYREAAVVFTLTWSGTDCDAGDRFSSWHFWQIWRCSLGSWRSSHSCCSSECQSSADSGTWPWWSGDQASGSGWTGTGPVCCPRGPSRWWLRSACTWRRAGPQAPRGRWGRSRREWEQARGWS